MIRKLPIKLPIFAHGFPIKTSKSATGYAATCTNFFGQSKRELTSLAIKIKKSRPISRILFLYPLSRHREDHHPSRSAIAYRFKQPTWRIERAAHRLSGLAPSGVYIANCIAAITGGLLHRRFTLTNIAVGGLLSVALIPRIAPGGRYPPPCSVKSGLSSAFA